MSRHARDTKTIPLPPVHPPEPPPASPDPFFNRVSVAGMVGGIVLIFIAQAGGNHHGDSIRRLVAVAADDG